ncbi:MAG: AraC family transcriptional regulator [Clostridia bacterium]|nr:AraC family transcriptional regulator [Clostridia bacterium]
MKKTINYTFQHEVESSEKTHFFFQKEPVLFHVPSFHNSYEIIYLLEGEAEAIISGKKHTLSAGDICIVPPNHVHYYKTFSKKIQAYVLVVGHNYSHHLRALYPDFSFELISKDKGKNAEIKALLDEWFLCRGGALKNFGYVNLLFDKCVALFGKVNTQHELPFENLAVQFIDYLQEHYKERITLENMAKHFGYSKIYFCALFKDLVGSTFLDVLNNIRMEKAVELMRDSHDKISIEQICEECGFTSVSTFYRLYRKHTLSN